MSDQENPAAVEQDGGEEQAAQTNGRAAVMVTVEAGGAVVVPEPIAPGNQDPDVEDAQELVIEDPDVLVSAWGAMSAAVFAQLLVLRFIYIYMYRKTCEIFSFHQIKVIKTK